MKIIMTFFLLTLFFVMAMGPNNSPGGTVSPLEADKQINLKAPDFTLRDVTGKTVSLAAFKGKVVLLNFWATWCPPCKAEMPSMNKLYKSLRQRGLEVIAISADNSLVTVKDYLNSSRFDFIVVHDEQRLVSKQYKVFSMPTTFLIDRNGLIVEKYYGEYDWTDVEVRKQIEKLL